MTQNTYTLTPVPPDEQHVAVISGEELLADERWQVLAYDSDDHPWVLRFDEADDHTFLIPMGALFAGWSALAETGKAYVEKS
jgi:hypothetical protein